MRPKPKHYAITLFLAVVAAVIVGLAAGWFASNSFHLQYRTLPRPSLKNTPLKPPTTNCAHVMGGCMPQPKTPATQTAPPLKQTTPKPSPTSQFTSLEFVSTGSVSITGPDLSNNDPVFSRGAWGAIAAHSRFAYDKSIEGTGFFDRTAAMMASLAKAFGLPVGGYDFMHVCLVSAVSEASFYVHSLQIQGLLGKGTLPPAGDAEWPLGGIGCSGRTWIQTWVTTVYNLDGHICPIMYTGAWWWQPHIGSFWPTCQNKQVLSWISGYHVRFPFMPSGVSHLDFWQFADDGFNGATSVDLSAWMHDLASFIVFARGAVKPVDPYLIYDKTKRHFHVRHGVVVASEYNTVKTWDSRGCENPPLRRTCVTTRSHMVLLRDRVWAVSHAAQSHDIATFGVQHKVDWGNHRLRRFLGMHRRVTAHRGKRCTVRTCG